MTELLYRKQWTTDDETDGYNVHDEDKSHHILVYEKQIETKPEESKLP